MPERYPAILRGNQLEWTGPVPSLPERNGATPVTIIVRRPVADAGHEMAAALEKLALEDPPAMGDAARWERSQRQDRPLPGRDDAC